MRIAQLAQVAIRGLPFDAQRRPTNWLDIASVSDYWEVLLNVLIGQVSHMNVSGKLAGVHIIGPTLIGDGSHICEGAEVVRSVVFEYTRVFADVTLNEIIVFKDYSVYRKAEMKHISDYSSEARPS